MVARTLGTVDASDRAAHPHITRELDDLISRGELGVQLSVYRNGEPLIDAGAGITALNGSPVTPDTIFFVASAGKVSTATLLHRQVARGLLRYEQPIADIWPAFGTATKSQFTVRDALTHQLGLAEVAPQTIQGEWDTVTARLATLGPSSDPLTHDAYHPFTWGFLVGEIARRADPTAKPFLTLIRDEVHLPLGITELWHALPAAEHRRVATASGHIFQGEPFDFALDEDHHFNSAAFRSHLDPSGAWMTARAGAKLWSLYATRGAHCGEQYLRADQVEHLLQPRRSSAPAGILVGERGIIGAGGLMLGGAVSDHARALGFGPRVLWHPGAGGALGFADLDTGISAMICHTRFFDERFLPQHPFAPLIRAIFDDARTIH